MDTKSFKDLTPEELEALLLEEAEAIVKARNASSWHWNISVEELIAFYALGVRDFSYADLSGANLSGANLSGADLRHANLDSTIGVWAITNIGSRNDTLKAWIWKGELRLDTGCQHGITVSEFRERLKDSPDGVREEYEDAIQFLERRLARSKVDVKS